MVEISGSGGWLIFSGGILSGLGLLHNLQVVSYWDVRISRFFHRRFNGFLPIFRTLWLFGKSPALIVILLSLILLNRQTGGWALLFYCVIAVAERAMKMVLKRQRPFSQLADVDMHQPSEPHDPSYPSGDAMRLWYLTIILPSAFSLPVGSLGMFSVIALVASLGRIAFGVHFFLDVIGGAGLGLLGAGFFLIAF